MALEEYVRKRKFENTPEPPAATKTSTARSGTAPRFLRAAPRRHPPALRFPPGNRRRAGFLGRSQRPIARARSPNTWPPKWKTIPSTTANSRATSRPATTARAASCSGTAARGNCSATRPSNEQLARGDLKFRLHGEKLKGEFALVLMKGRGKGNEWLLIKKRDADAVEGWDIEQHAWSVLSGRTQQEIAAGLAGPQDQARDCRRSAARMEEPPRAAGRRAGAAKPRRRPPKTKARRQPRLAEGRGEGRHAHRHHTHESGARPKLLRVATNGSSKSNGTACAPSASSNTNPAPGLPHRPFLRETVSRTQRDPALLAAEQAILDGEIAVLDEKGVAHFELIQPRIASPIPTPSRTWRAPRPVVYFAFDLLYLNGYDLRQVAARRAQAAAGIDPDSHRRAALFRAFPRAGDAMMQAARETGVEGLMAKRASSCYESRRSKRMDQAQNRPAPGVRHLRLHRRRARPFRRAGAGRYDDGKLTWAGNVGTGFDQKTLGHRCARNSIRWSPPQSPFPDAPKVGKDVTWVKPELVAEVKFANWTNEGRLRAPVYLGLRPDVNPRDCVREDRSARPLPRPKNPCCPPQRTKSLSPSTSIPSNSPT